MCLKQRPLTHSGLCQNQGSLFLSSGSEFWSQYSFLAPIYLFMPGIFLFTFKTKCPQIRRESRPTNKKNCVLSDGQRVLSHLQYFHQVSFLTTVKYNVIVKVYFLLFPVHTDPKYPFSRQCMFTFGLQSFLPKTLAKSNF